MDDYADDHIFSSSGRATLITDNDTTVNEARFTHVNEEDLAAFNARQTVKNTERSTKTLFIGNVTETIVRLKTTFAASMFKSHLKC